MIGFGDSECMFVFFAVCHRMPRYVPPLAHPYSWLQPTQGGQRELTPAGSYRPASVDHELCEKSVAYVDKEIPARYHFYKVIVRLKHSLR